MKIVFIFTILYLCFYSYGLNFCTPNDILQRSYDGKCNNLVFKESGKAGSYFKRGAEKFERYIWSETPKLDNIPTYADKHLLPSDGPRGNPRDISNALSIRHDESIVDPNSHSVFGVLFGQFLNHDLESNYMVNEDDLFDVPLATYILNQTDDACLATDKRPFPHPDRCFDNNTIIYAHQKFSHGIRKPNGVLDIINRATSYFDLDTIYGRSKEESDKLRLHYRGKLKYSPSIKVNVTFTENPPYIVEIKNQLPTYDMTGMGAEPLYTQLGTNGTYYTSGDPRVNENLGLILMHTLWVREHNKVAEELINNNILYQLFPKLFEDNIFEEARKITIAKYQKIIYEQYFPSVYGQYFSDMLGNYKGYDFKVDTTTSAVFASLSFRYGHFALKEYFSLDECGVAIYNNKPLDNQEEKLMHLGFLNPFPQDMLPVSRIALAGGLPNIVRGLINERAAPNHLTVNHVLRNFHSSWGVVDMVAIDIQRARYNGIPNYQKIRKHYHKVGHHIDSIYGLSDCPANLESKENIDDPLECFLHITSDINVASKLKELYKKINKIDPIIGLQAEDKVGGTSFGRTSGNIITDQFKRLRDGDRFFYKNIWNTFGVHWKNVIENTTIGEILRRNMDDYFNYPDNAFIAPNNYRQQLAESCQ